MPVEATVIPEISAPPGYPRRKRWTRAECRALESTGLWNNEKLELIEGDLIDKTGKNRPHVTTTMLMMRWLIGVFGIMNIATEAPIDIAPGDNPTSEPEPDLAVLAQPCSAFTTSNPQPSDVRMVVEISDTILAFDRKVKAGLYARGEIADYWVVDVTGQRIVVHREPRDGAYADVASYGVGESIEPLSAPGRRFPVADAFPS